MTVTADWLTQKASRLADDFQRDGFVSIPAFLDGDALAELRTHKERFLRDVVPSMPEREVYFEDRADPRSLKQLQQMGSHDAYFAGLQTSSTIADLAEILLAEPVVGKNVQYFNKPKGCSRATPAHQDGFYFKLQPNHAVTVWLALEDVSVAQGCVHYVPGSHRAGLLPHRQSEVLGFSQELVSSRKDLDDVAFPCQAGHLIAHHALTIHWAGGNVSEGKSREALGFIYYGKSAQEDRQAHAEYQRRLASDLAEQGRI